jgi:sulfoxide reductase heme-binding subunit YedZ
MSPNTLWYVGRGSGLVDLLLLTLVVVLGIVNRSGRPAAGLPRFGVAVVHRNASLLALAFLVVHVLTLLLDPLADLHAYDLLVPFAAVYRPLWMGVGTVGLDLMLALVVTSLLRHRIGLRVWRFIHWAAYAAWLLAVAHTLGTGTDNTSAWLLDSTTVCVLAVIIAVVWRVSAGFSETSQVRAGPQRSTMDGRR